MLCDEVIVPPATPNLRIFLDLTRAIARTRAVEPICDLALDALTSALPVTRAAVLLFGDDGVMRFQAWRRLSDAYRAAVEGHTPWRQGDTEAEAIVVPDVAREPSLSPWLPAIAAEGIAALAFIPLESGAGVIGKFMIYFDAPRALGEVERQTAVLIAQQVAFAVERTRTEIGARRSAERLRFALDAAQMGTWDWDLRTNAVQWSDNLEPLHGLPRGAFQGSFDAYAREIHPEDRDKVFASVQRALREGVPHEVEYRLVAPDGTIRWCEGKGRVEHESGTPVSMTGVCMMVTRRKEAELARLAAAEEASRLKDEFLATLSHELRTPLNAILGWVQMIESARLPPDRLSHAIAVIARNARLQAQLIEDMLDVSRIITGKLDIERAPLDVARLAGSVVEAFAPAAAARGVTLDAAPPDEALPVIGDARRLQQVLGNVVSNAIKFTGQGGRVELACRRAGNAIELEVRDTGTGIDPAFLPYIFDRFRQADSRVTREHGGLGLGLAIARHLVALHGGRIHAHSDGAGRGTTITISLPAAVADAPAAIHPDCEAAGSARHLRELRALVVDDQADSREVIAAMLASAGAVVLQADSAGAALEILSRERVHLLVADIAMPRMDGYELMRRARATYATLRAVAVSAYARPQDSSAALAAGFDAYCAKPVELPALLAAIGSVATAPAP